MRYTFLLPLVGLLLATSGRALAQTPTLPDSTRPKTYTYTERMPVFPVLAPADSAVPANQRFMRFINADVHYPAKALRDGISGQVLFSFAVNAEGRTQGIKVVKGLRADIDAEVLRNAHRLDAIQWEPGTQNGRPVTVSFTAPMNFNIANGRTTTGDSLAAPGFNKGALPVQPWAADRRILPTDRGIIFGSCVQRLGFNSGGLPQFVRLANLSTGKAVTIEVKPGMRSRKESAFCYALPPGRYALYRYQYSISRWYGAETHDEQLLKSAPAPGAPLSATRYVFTVVAGTTSCVGTWNFTQENQPVFSTDKARLNAELQPIFKNLTLSSALLRVPR